MKPFTVLWHIPSVMLSIIGDEDGNLGTVTDEALANIDASFLSKELKVVSVITGEDVRMPRPTGGDPETISIDKHVIEGRWGVRCGYGPKTKAWVLRSPEPRDLTAVETESQ